MLKKIKSNLADDELQQVQEDGTDGLDVVVQEVRILTEQQAHNNSPSVPSS